MAVYWNVVSIRMRYRLDLLACDVSTNICQDVVAVSMYEKALAISTGLIVISIRSFSQLQLQPGDGEPLFALSYFSEIFPETTLFPDRSDRQ